MPSLEKDKGLEANVLYQAVGGLTQYSVLKLPSCCSPHQGMIRTRAPHLIELTIAIAVSVPEPRESSFDQLVHSAMRPRYPATILLWRSTPLTWYIGEMYWREERVRTMSDAATLLSLHRVKS